MLHVGRRDERRRREILGGSVQGYAPPENFWNETLWNAVSGVPETGETVDKASSEITLIIMKTKVL